MLQFGHSVSPTGSCVGNLVPHLKMLLSDEVFFAPCGNFSCQNFLHIHSSEQDLLKSPAHSTSTDVISFRHKGFSFLSKSSFN